MAIPLNNPNLTPQQLNDFKALEQTLKNANKNADLFADAINKAGSNTTKIAQELNAMEGYVNGLTNATKQFNASLTDSLDLAQGIVDALTKKKGAIERATKAMSSLVSLGQQLVYEDQKLDALSERQLEKMTKEAKLREKQLQDQVKTIAGSLNQQSINTRILQFEQGLATAIQNQDTKTQDILEKKLEILKAYNDSERPYQRLVELVKERYHLEQQVTKTFGLTGVALAAASSIASKFGMSHIQDQLEDINNKLKYEMREEIKANGDQALGFGRRFEYAARAVGGVSKAILKGMLDPLFIMGKIFSAFLDVNKAAVELTRLTGQNSEALAGANFRQATSVDFLKTAVELTQQLGFNAQNIFSADVIAGAAELKNMMGLSAEEAGGLALMAQSSGKSIDNITDSVVATTSAFNAANRSAVSQGQVLKDVATTSDAIKLSLGNNPEAISKAASAARRLGLELKEVDQIAASLLEFETSIENELEAELLVNKDLNLEKARELALNNNLAGVGEEILKNSADINEFGKLNRIQQEAYAKALGLSRDQLARIAYNRALELNMTEDQAAAAAGVTAEDMKRMDVQESIQKSLDKLAQAFAPILSIVADIAEVLGAIISPIAGAVGMVVKLLDALYATKIVIGAIVLYLAGPAIVGGIAGMVKGFKNLTGLGTTLKGSLQGFKQTLNNSWQKGSGMVQAKSGKFYAPNSPQGKMITNLSGGAGDKAKEAAESAAEPAKKAGGPSTLGKSIKSTLTGISGGLATFKKVSAADIAKATLAAVPLAALAVVSPGLLLLQMVKGPAIRAALKGIGEGLSALGKSVANGPAILGIAVLTAAVIGIGFALGLAAPAIEAFGKVVTSVFAGIAALIPIIVDGFVKLISTVSESIFPMLLLGPALIGIAAGLAAISLAGPMAIPALLAVTGLAAVAGGVAAIFGGDEEKSVGESKEKAEEGTLKGVEDKLAQLITVIQQGGEVRLDGKKIGTTMSRTMPLTATKTN